MPNTHAALKALRKSRVRTAANLRIKTNVKTLLKKGLVLAKEGKKKEALEVAKSFQQAVDKAAKRNVVSKNKANRKKSDLMKAVNGIKA